MNKFFARIILAIIAFLIPVVLSLGPYRKTVEHTVKPRLKSTKKYTPTNAWFENLLLGKGESAIQTYPYQIKAKASGLCISYSGSGKIIVQENYVLEGYLDNLALSTRETLESPLIDQSTVDSNYFDLSVKINYGSKFDVIVTRGSASVIANYRSVTPVFKTIHAILNMPSTIQTRNLKLNFNNDQTWLIQSEFPITWTPAGSEVSASSLYTGWIKISIVTSSEHEKALEENLNSYPITNGRVKYNVDRVANKVVVDLEYNHIGLFYLLPHIYETEYSGPKLINGANVRGIKGKYLLASGNGYQYKVPIYKPSDKRRAVDSEEKRNNLNSALKNDAATLEFNTKDPYFGGKELARAANLIEIADLLGDITSKEKIKKLLLEELDDFWFGIRSGEPALVYEPTWGGIVSNASVGSAEADFGQYYYNDHHFHYGYFINTAATLAKHYPEYFNSRAEYFRIIIADFAGTCEYEELPCQPRAKDPFLGHSYAAGIFEFSDSRNQESTSESVNGYFAVRELGSALNDKNLEDLGDYLLSTEIFSSQVYWQLKNPSDIYPMPYAENKVVGILWETKVDYATFFGLNPEYIYGIQMLPYNDITEQLLDKQWLKYSKSVWGKVVESSEDSWKCFLLLADALIEPMQTGLSQKIHNLKEYDNGNSRTNTLYFYYMIGGTPSGGNIDVITPPIGGGTTTQPSITNPTGCTGDCDQGKPDPICGSSNLACFNNQGQLIGCYDKNSATCFSGGNICPKPLVACLNVAAIQQGAPCYNPSQYNCVNGALQPIGRRRF